MVPVTAGVGVGHENRIMENRRLKLKSGKKRTFAMPIRSRPMRRSPR